MEEFYRNLKKVYQSKMARKKENSNIFMGGICSCFDEAIDIITDGQYGEFWENTREAFRKDVISFFEIIEDEENWSKVYKGYSSTSKTLEDYVEIEVDEINDYYFSPVGFHEHRLEIIDKLIKKHEELWVK